MVPPSSSQATISKQITRQDIRTAVAFLYTRVREPDTNDYKKLTMVIKYLRNTRNMTLTMELDNKAKWRVDSSYAVNQT